MPNRAKRWAFDRSVSMKTSKKSAEEILQKPWKTPWKTHGKPMKSQTCLWDKIPNEYGNLWFSALKIGSSSWTADQGHELYGLMTLSNEAVDKTFENGSVSQQKTADKATILATQPKQPDKDHSVTTNSANLHDNVMMGMRDLTNNWFVQAWTSQASHHLHGFPGHGFWHNCAFA